MTPAKKDIKFNFKIDKKYSNDNVVNKKEKSPYETEWWKKFNDEKLNNLIKEVIKNNLDLKLAFGNINILRAQYQLSKVNTMPIVTASGGANIARSPVTGFEVTPTGMTKTTSAQVNDSYSLQMNAMFELDLFDKYGALSRSALNNLKSSEADYNNVYFMIISQTIMAYYDIKMIKKTIKLNEKIIESYNNELETQKSRYEAGLGASFNVNSLEQTIFANKSTIEDLKKQLTLRKYSLKILLGKYPENDDIFDDNTEQVVEKLEDLSIGIPSDLLKNRFDIISAEKKLESAREQIGYKKADRYPSISLSAAIGYMNILDLGNFFDSDFITMSGGVNVNQTVFSYGSKKAAYEQAVEQYNLSLLNYKKTILNAFNEVESVLIKIATYKKQKEYLTNSLEFSNKSLEEAKRRFVGGIGEYNTLLDLTKAKFSMEINILNIEKGIILSYIELYKSIGKR
jgi:multidrug efflux system outer membrane protein